MRMSRAPKTAAAASGWWLSGGVSAANAVAVYQPIGAASLAASYVNLANPGTYNAAPGVAPTWASATGWTFNGTTQYLDIGSPITGTEARTIIARYKSVKLDYSAIVDLCISSVPYSPDTSSFYMTPEQACRFAGGNRIWAEGTTSDVVFAIVGPAGGSITDVIGYRDGVLDNTYSTSGTTYNTGTRGGGIAIVSSAHPSWYKGDIMALAIYNAALTAPQVAAITTAMNALTG